MKHLPSQFFVLSLALAGAAVLSAAAPSSAPRMPGAAAFGAGGLLPINHRLDCQGAGGEAFVRSLPDAGYAGLVCNMPWWRGDFGKVNYLDDEANWDGYRKCLDAARAVGLDVWLYDELGYPSLSAGDRVLRGHPELESTGYLVSVTEVAGGTRAEVRVPRGLFRRAVAYPLDAQGAFIRGRGVDLGASYRAGRVMPTPPEFEECTPYDAAGRPKGGFGGWRAKPWIGSFAWSAPAGNEKWIAFVITEDFVFEGTQAHRKGFKVKFRYPNALRPAATRRFLEVNHEEYARHLGNDLGKYFTSTFTDEPHIMAAWWVERPDEVLPSAPELTDAYRAACGRDLLDDLPLLVRRGSGSGAVRIDFWTTVADLYVRAFFRPVSDWCRAHGFLSGGHLMGEELFNFHVSHYGDFFRCLQALDVPSVDCLNATAAEMNFLTPLYGGSARELIGSRYAMCEVNDWTERHRNPPVLTDEVNLRGVFHRQQWGGINALTSYYNLSHLKPEAVRRLNADVARVQGEFLAFGNSAAEIALYYPARDLMAAYEPHGDTWVSAKLPIKKLENRFKAAAASLYEHGRCFLIVDDKAIEASVLEKGELVHGKLRFKALVMPVANRVPDAVRAKVDDFVKAGGVVLDPSSEPAETAVFLAKRLPPQIAPVASAPTLRMAVRTDGAAKRCLVIQDAPTPWKGELTLRDGGRRSVSLEAYGAMVIDFALSAVCLAGNADKVDTQYGTGRVDGNCMVGPCLPHASAYPSPDSVWPLGKKAAPTSGRYPGDPIAGFSQLHTQGTGGIVSYGLFLVKPCVGSDPYLPSHLDISEAHPYRFRGLLRESGIRVEIEPTHHGALYVFDFPKGKEGRVEIDEKCKIGLAVASSNCWKKTEGNVTCGGGTYFGNWNPAPYDCFFHAETETNADRLILRIAVSFKSAETAKRWFDAELRGKGADFLAEAARRIWDDRLGCVTIAGASAAEERKFYSNLFHAFVQPRDRTDDFAIYGAGEPVWDDHYTMWDTWKTLFPLMTLVDPKMMASCVNSFAARMRRNGECSASFIQGREYRTGQGGDDADNIIADAVLKDVPGIDLDGAWHVLEKNAARRIPEYRTLGWVPYGVGETIKTDYCWRLKSASSTLGFAYNDWCAAQVAKKLGKTEAAAALERRSYNWTNVWDAALVDGPSGYRGFVHGRHPDGSFTKIDPRGGWQIWHGDNDPRNYWGDFYEGSAWDYSWNVWHDLPRLMKLMGGKEKFLERLAYAFDNKLIEYGNEPSFMTPLLFDFAGRRDLAARWARAFRARYTDKGCPGDDDAGAMGSMFVFLTMGFNPIAGQDLYALHAPAVPEVRLVLPANGGTLMIRRTGDGLGAVTLNGRVLAEPFLRHRDLLAGGELVFGSSAER